MGRVNKIAVISERKYKFEGYFDAKEVYKALKDYLEESRHYDYSERDLDEKNDGKTVKIITKAEAEQQFNDYYMTIIMYVLELNGKVVEIEVGGKKKMLTEGKATLTLNSYIKPDYLGKRHDGPLGQFLGRLWDEFFGKDELSDCMLQTVKDINGLIAVFKQQVNSKL